MEKNTARPPKEVRKGTGPANGRAGRKTEPGRRSGAAGPGAGRRGESGERTRATGPGGGQRTGLRKRTETPGPGGGRRGESGERTRATGPGAGRRAEPGKRSGATYPASRLRKDIRKVKASPKAEAEPVRLNKFIANSGVCARREADELIKQGYITVNGKKVTDMGIKVTTSDIVEYRGKKLVTGKKVYVLLNKPKGYVTTVKDPHAEFTVLDLVRESTTERIYPVGRLDKATTGVLLLTNDGDLAGKLTHPSFGARKVYHVFLDRDVTRHDMEAIVDGVDLEDGKVSADAISYADSEDRSQVGIELHSGQNRVVRRIFEKLGYSVRKLDRVSFAGLTKKNLQRGHWRHLTPKEISMLKRGIYK